MIDRVSDSEAKEQAHFNHIAEKYFTKDLIHSSSIARQLRLKQTLKHARLQKHHKILEVGCGGGFSASYLKGNYDQYLGIDYSKKLIEYANRYFNLSNTFFRTLNIKDLESDYNDFDMVLMIGVLHHMDDIEEVLLKIKTHLKPGGILAVNEPQPSNPLITFSRRIRKKLDATYSKEQKELSAKKLLNIFGRTGYINIHSYPQGLFSTPFAEIPMKPQRLTTPLSLLACEFDSFLENYFPRYLTRLSWNLVLTGEKPAIPY